MQPTWKSEIFNLHPKSPADAEPPKEPSPSKKAKIRRWKARHLWFALVVVVGMGVLASLGMAWVWVKSLDIGKLSKPLPAPSYVYDRSGAKASQLSSSTLEPVKLEQISKHMKNAIIAVEDRRFYTHSGVDLVSISRALYRDLRMGSFAEGGSTITQQLAKNMFLPTDKSLGRKMTEAGYAYKINSTFTKDQILELYLNQIYFGEGAYGVQGASKHYFNKNAADLSIEEAALLAGLPKAPSANNPVKNKTAALDRRNVVLALMKEQNYITDEEYKLALAAPIALATEKPDDLKGKNPAYVDYVIDEATKVYGFTEQQITTGGLQLYTELNPAVQAAVDEVYANNDFFPTSQPDQLIQSGAVVLNHYTGGIQAIAGSRKNSAARGFNHATELANQPGSAFKPIAVYAPALEKGYTPNSILYDGPLDINGYKPQNWDRQYRGQVTMQDAIMNSWNIPAVWLLNEIGITTGMDFTTKLGIPLTKDDRKLGIALGGLSKGVSPLQMAQAFSAFANQGSMFKAHAITKITTADGKVLAEAKPSPTQVMSAQNAYTMTQLLQNAVMNGTGHNALLDRPVAGKTGTTQLPATKEFADIGNNGTKDAWFVGYTPELTAAIWLGYDKTDKNHYLTTSGGAAPAVLFREIMVRALKGTTPMPFNVPQGYVNPFQQAQSQPADQPPAETAAQLPPPQQPTVQQPRPKRDKQQDMRDQVNKWLEQQRKQNKYDHGRGNGRGQGDEQDD